MRLLFFLLLFYTGFILAHGQLSPQEINIPMRDGQDLAADLYLPNQTDEFPIIVIQTPYNKNFYANNGLPLGIGENIQESPYAFVIIDWRCFFASGDACGGESTRGQDGYDAVEWIAEQEWCNGKVGTWGPSALGNVQFETAKEQPPHLTCSVPLVPSPITRYSTYYPGGSLRAEYLESLNFLFGAIGGFDLVLQNPFDNGLWTITEVLTSDFSDINVPFFIVAGWYDHNTTENFELINSLVEDTDPALSDEHKIIIGPWVHGGTGQANVGSSVQGELEYPEAALMDTEMALEFFAYYLLEEENSWADNERYIWFRMGDDEWKGSDEWPPATENSTLYLHGDGSLQSSNPDEEWFNAHPYDPTDPSPTIGGKTLNIQLEQGPYDQRFEVEARPDVQIYSTDVLQEPLSVEGQITVSLEVSTDALDTDFCVRLTDVYPDGRSMLLGEDIQRMRFRSEDYSESGAELCQAGENYVINLEFDPLSITFLPGHRIRLIISSSNYPRYNRNMNTGAEMYPNLNSDTLVNPQIATNSVIIRSDLSNSFISLPILETTDISEANEDKFQLFPNPCTDHLNLSLIPAGIEEVIIWGEDGRMLMRQPVNGPSGTIAMKSIPAGSHIIQLLGDELKLSWHFTKVY